ncbi:MAG: hypothetical protein P8P30_05840 [Rickettsiales bacterium]|nr:hypothetical protein [Rickettsiales bacterium]
MATLLLTSTRDVSQTLAPKIEAVGHKALLMPLLKITYFDDTAGIEPPTAILISSRYALRAAEHHIGTPLYIVGQQTANLAMEKGHHIEQIATNISYLKDKLPTGTLYLRGRDVSQELDIPSYICYTADHVAPPPPLAEHDGLIVLSARIAAKLPLSTKPLFCLSQRIAQALPNEMQAQARIPEEPTENALLEMIKHWSPEQ